MGACGIMEKDYKQMHYDWEKIKKEVKPYIPKEIYNPFNMHDFNDAAWIIDLSIRGLAKTTSYLLIILALHKHYPEFEGVYMRENYDMISPKMSGTMFNVIIENNYIHKMYKGRWNTVIYKNRKWYLAYYDSETDKTEMDIKPFMHMLALTEMELSKSGLQLPHGDLIFFDECISRYNYYDEFVQLCQAISSVIRKRFDPVIICCANNTDVNAYIFHELAIWKDVQTLQVGTCKYCKSPLGTSVQVAWIGQKVEEMSDRDKEHNKKYFGFLNPKLNSIRGGDWAIKNYPHTRHTETSYMILNNMYIYHNNEYIQLELWNNEENGYYINAHFSNLSMHTDTIIYKLDEIRTNQDRYGLGFTKFDKFVFNLFTLHKWFFSDNRVGNQVENYLQCCSQKKEY